MSFDKHSNFNKLANFSEVKFGENMPVLEVELNEMQQIQNEARADIIRDTMPSGFVTLGEIDYDHCASKDNQLKLKTESIAYVNGYRITIPKDTIIEIGESDKVREDLVFLEVWKEVVTDNSELKEYGGEDNEVINNPIKDSRYPVATTQRVALKYRIRHVGDVDFSEDTSGLSSLSYDFHPSDKGLYIKTFSESIDGLVYAIPMFRLLRKPNVGLASPFEYKKIHNQLDPKKFAHLVGQENVEKVHSVNIKGRTLVNLATSPLKTVTATGSWQPLSPISLVSGKKYLAIFHVESNTLDNVIKDVFKSNDDVDTVWGGNIVPAGGVGTFKKTFVAPFDTNNYNIYSDTSSQGSATVKCVLLEYIEGMENWDLKYFEGMKSLGELDNNSITVENDIIEEGTYVHELQNHILPTYLEVTHVTWGEDVVIPPEVEIELKNGEEVIQTITQLPVKLETTGEEKLHVKTMKGRTLVNLSPKRPYDFSCHGNDTDIYSVNSGVNEITLTINEYPNNWRYIYIPLTLNLLEPNTKYLVIFDGNFSGSFSIKSGNSSYPLEKESVHNSGKNSVVIETNDLSNGIKDQFLYLYPTAPNTFPHTYKVSNIRFIKYQEGMENWGLKYFEGMKSVEAPSIRVVGKNLYTHQKAEVQGVYKQDVVVYVPVSLNTTYTFDASSKIWATVTLYNTGGSETRQLGAVQDSKVVTFTTDSSEVLAKLSFYNGDNTNIKDVDFEKLQIQFVEGSDIPPYELGKLNELKTPKGTVLRSLNPSLFDSIDFKTGELTSKIGETTITGKNSENNYIDNSSLTEHTRYRFQKSDLNLKYSSVENQYFKSNVLPCITTAWNQESEGFQADMSSPKWLWIRVKNSRLSSTDIPGVTAWLDNNPVTVQYEYSSPVTKKIELSEDDYVGKSKVTYQLAEPLNYIPGGYFDEIKGNKLIKRTGVITLDGSSDENWSIAGDYNSYGQIQIPHMKKNSNLFTNLLCQVIISSGVEDNPIGIMATENSIPTLRLRPFDHNNITLDEITSWLNASPLTVIFELANPIEIPLKEVSPLECDFSRADQSPYMPLNSYVGSLYVADGINQTKFLTAFSPSEYEVQTYHRYFSNEFNMLEDIKRKKSPYGHKTYLEEVDGKYVEKFIAGLEKHEIEDLRHKVSLTGFDYNQLLQDSFLKLIEGELS